MAKVEIIEFTGKGRPDEQWHAADVLLFTKSTRLNMTPGLLAEIKAWPEEKKRAELEFMTTTVPSSWEFVSVTFLISGVTRAIAQQITRTRSASYAMQAQRVNNIADAGVLNPFEVGSDLYIDFEVGVAAAKDSYTRLVAGGAKLEDARAIMPIHTECNLCASYNLRSLVDLLRKRSSPRVQGEYVDIANQMRALVTEVWPWSAPFFRLPQEAALKLLGDVLAEMDVTPGEGAGWRIAKAMDLIRNAS